MYLSSPYHDKNFDHAIRIQDIFRKYVDHLPPVTRAPRFNKRKVNRRKTISDGEYLRLPYEVSRFAMDYILKGVINNEFMFSFAKGTAIIKYFELHHKSAFYKRYKDLDALKNNFRAYLPGISVKNGDLRKNIHIYLDEKYISLIKERLKTTDRFSNIRVLTLMGLSKQVQKKFPKFELDVIYKILLHLFKYIKGAIAYNVNIIFYLKSEIKMREYVLIKGCKKKYSRDRMLLDKYLFLYKMEKGKYDKWCYFALTHEEYNNYKTTPVSVKIHACMETAMLKPLIRPHIFRIKMEKPINAYSTISTISYETHNTKYIWRWDEQRFTSVNNTKLRSNRLSKCNVDNF